MLVLDISSEEQGGLFVEATKAFLVFSTTRITTVTRLLVPCQPQEG